MGLEWKKSGQEGPMHGGDILCRVRRDGEEQEAAVEGGLSRGKKAQIRGSKIPHVREGRGIT